LDPISNTPEFFEGVLQAACKAPAWSIKTPSHLKPALADPGGHQAGAAPGVSTAAWWLWWWPGCGGLCGLGQP